MFPTPPPPPLGGFYGVVVVVPRAWSDTAQVFLSLLPFIIAGRDGGWWW